MAESFLCFDKLVESKCAMTAAIFLQFLWLTILWGTMLEPYWLASVLQGISFAFFTAAVFFSCRWITLEGDEAEAVNLKFKMMVFASIIFFLNNLIPGLMAIILIIDDP